MSRTEILLMLLGMTLATYIPRALPFVLLDRMRFGPRVEKFLRLIPYTAMSALIFPGLLSADAQRPWIPLAGGLAAALLALRRKNAIVCVVAAIAVCFVLNLIV